MTDNVFEQMDAEKTPENTESTAKPEAEQQSQEPVNAPGEVNLEKLSDTAIGEKKKYDRVDLDGKTVTIAKAQLFEADTSEEPTQALKNKSQEYYKANFILHYETENEDREYISGVVQFVQRDGSLSPHNFWYPGAQNQAAKLWEAVADFKQKEPSKLSPREFMAFLNGKPKAVLKAKSFKNPTTGDNTTKNMVSHFVA